MPSISSAVVKKIVEFGKRVSALRTINQDLPESTSVYDVVSVTNTATILRVGGSNLANRRTITIQPKGSTIYVGFDASVTAGNSGNGIKVTSNSVLVLSKDENTDVYAIKSGGGSSNVYVSEAT